MPCPSLTTSNNGVGLMPPIARATKSRRRWCGLSLRGRQHQPKGRGGLRPLIFVGAEMLAAKHLVHRRRLFEPLVAPPTRCPCITGVGPPRQGPQIPARGSTPPSPRGSYNLVRPVSSTNKRPTRVEGQEDRTTRADIDPAEEQALEVHLEPLSPWLRWLLVALGSVALVIGLIGLALPIVPQAIPLLFAFTALSLASEGFWRFLERLLSRWPSLRARVARLRQRAHRALSRRRD